MRIFPRGKEVIDQVLLSSKAAISLSVVALQSGDWTTWLKDVGFKGVACTART